MKYAVGAIIGAVIGYLTNWLAIKMLFRPHEEKRIFGIKVPFTPGLIPKEQKRIAASVGSAVGEYLLTEETIIKNLTSDKVQNYIVQYLEGKVKDICESTKTIGQIISMVSKDKYESIVIVIKTRLSTLLIDKMHKPELKEKLLGILEEELKRFLDENPREIQEKLGINLNSIIQDKLVQGMKAENSKKKLQQKIQQGLEDLKKEDMMIRDICSEELVDYIKDYAAGNKAEIARYIEVSLKEPWVEEKLRAAVNEAVDSNLNPLIAMFINSEVIYGKVTEFLKNYLQDDEKQEDIVRVIQKIIDHIVEMHLSEFLKGEKDEEKVSQSLVKLIENDRIIKILNDTISDVIDGNKSLNDMLMEVDSNCYSKINGLLSEKIEKMLYSENIRNMISSYISKIVDEILNLKLNSMLEDKKEKINSTATCIGQSIINKFITREGKKVIEILDISHIVEEEINKFPVDMGEKIIVGIARKELSAITWLGALLGGIIGILSPVISTLI